MEVKASVVQKHGAVIEEVAVLDLRAFHSSAVLTYEAKLHLNEKVHFSKFPFFVLHSEFPANRYQITRVPGGLR